MEILALKRFYIVTGSNKFAIELHYGILDCNHSFFFIWNLWSTTLIEERFVGFAPYYQFLILTLVLNSVLVFVTVMSFAVHVNFCCAPLF